MKIVYNDGEKEALMRNYDKLSLKLFDDSADTVYSINFKVTNPAIAQFILVDLLHNKIEDFDMGIDVVSINFNQIQNKDDVKQKLHNMIEEIIQ